MRRRTHRLHAHGHKPRGCGLTIRLTHAFWALTLGSFRTLLMCGSMRRKLRNDASTVDQHSAEADGCYI